MITIKEIKENLIERNLSIINGTDLDMEFLVWNLSDMDELNKGYEVKEYHNGYYAIGSNGGGEMLTINLKTGIVYAIPFISTDNNEKIKVAESIMELVKS